MAQAVSALNAGRTASRGAAVRPVTYGSPVKRPSQPFAPSAAPSPAHQWLNGSVYGRQGLPVRPEVAST